jgi:hypothetical protein
MARAGKVVVDEPFAATAGEAAVDEVRADGVVAAGAAFTLLFTKRCSLAS